MLLGRAPLRCVHSVLPQMCTQQVIQCLITAACFIVHVLGVCVQLGWRVLCSRMHSLGLSLVPSLIMIHKGPAKGLCR